MDNDLLKLPSSGLWTLGNVDNIHSDGRLISIKKIIIRQLSRQIYKASRNSSKVTAAAAPVMANIEKDIHSLTDRDKLYQVRSYRTLHLV